MESLRVHNVDKREMSSCRNPYISFRKTDSCLSKDVAITSGVPLFGSLVFSQSAIFGSLKVK